MRMDYAFAPGVTDYDELMRKLLNNRKTATRATTLIQKKKLTTVAGFFTHLKNTPAAQIPKPVVGDLLIASHGNDLGWMQIDLVGSGAETTTGTKPCYFNSGCCCFGDGDITGIEIIDSKIKLVRWPNDKGDPLPQELASADLIDAFAASQREI